MSGIHTDESSGLATSDNQDLSNTKLDTLNAKDFSTSAKQDTQITNQSTLNTRVGDLTEPAPATDTASSGLNGRLQRIAQRLTSIVTTLTDKSQFTKLVSGSDGVTPVGTTGDALKVIMSQSGLAESGTLFSASKEINASDSDEDNPLLLLKNPTASAKKFFIWRARIGSVVTNTSMICRVFLNPTVTANGTALTPVNRNVGGGSNPSPVSEVYTTPTCSSLGTLLTIAVIGQNTVSIDLNENFSIILNPNTSLLITGKPSSNNREAGVSLVWQENGV